MFKTLSCTSFQTYFLSTIPFHHYPLPLWETRHIPIGGGPLPSGQQSRTDGVQRPDTHLQITLLEAA